MQIANSVIRYVASIAILLVALWVALSPSVVYAPVPKGILFLLCALLPPILLGAEVSDKLEWKLPGLLLTVSGAAAVCFGGLYLLFFLTKPEQQIAIFDLYNEQGDAVDLEVAGAYSISPAGGGGLTPTAFAAENHLVLIFPEQLGSTIVSVRKTSSGKPYIGEFSYSGNRTYRKELKSDHTIQSAQVASP